MLLNDTLTGNYLGGVSPPAFKNSTFKTGFGVFSSLL